MGFIPSTTLLHPMKIEWNSLSAPNKVKITVTDGAGIASPYVFIWTPDAGFDPTGAIGFVNWNGGVAFFDDLTVDADPQTKDDCKKGGWEQFGFKNQGQCVRFIETGKDSR